MNPPPPPPHAHKPGTDYAERVLPSIIQETLKSVIAQYNASQLLTMREVGAEVARWRPARWRLARWWLAAAVARAWGGGAGWGRGPAAPAGGEGGARA